MAHILVVDDDDMQCTTLSHVLSKEGHNVYIAKNGVEALELYNPDLINLVISDIVMPEMEGMELIRRLRSINKKVSIIAISGNMIGKDFLEIACKLGARYQLAKPIDTAKLLNIIKEELNNN